MWERIGGSCRSEEKPKFLSSLDHFPTFPCGKQVFIVEIESHYREEFLYLICLEFLKIFLSPSSIFYFNLKTLL